MSEEANWKLIKPEGFSNDDQILANEFALINAAPLQPDNNQMQIMIYHHSIHNGNRLHSARLVRFSTEMCSEMRGGGSSTGEIAVHDAEMQDETQMIQEVSTDFGENENFRCIAVEIANVVTLLSIPKFTTYLEVIDWMKAHKKSLYRDDMKVTISIEGIIIEEDTYSTFVRRGKYSMSFARDLTTERKRHRIGDDETQNSK